MKTGERVNMNLDGAFLRMVLARGVEGEVFALGSTHGDWSDLLRKVWSVFGLNPLWVGTEAVDTNAGADDVSGAQQFELVMIHEDVLQGFPPGTSRIARRGLLEVVKEAQGKQAQGKQAQGMSPDMQELYDGRARQVKVLTDDIFRLSKENGELRSRVEELDKANARVGVSDDEITQLSRASRLLKEDVERLERERDEARDELHGARRAADHYEGQAREFAGRIKFLEEEVRSARSLNEDMIAEMKSLEGGESPRAGHKAGNMPLLLRLSLAAKEAEQNDPGGYGGDAQQHSGYLSGLMRAAEIVEEWESE